MRARSYYVYVVELLSVRGVREVYVGSSALQPSKRFTEHKKGRGPHTSGVVKRRGVRLLPAYYARENPFATRDAARRAEDRIRRRLEGRGYVVRGACTSRARKGCRL
jgi:hypothetical protein